jgi:winged helix domain-containing protein/ATPase family protein associated with various cellular activities (AAA)
MKFINFPWLNRKKPMDQPSELSPDQQPFQELSSGAEITAEMTGTSLEAEEKVVQESEGPDHTDSRQDSRAYANSDEHLWDEFGRIDQMIHAQTKRWLYTIAEHKEVKHWGMAYVSQEEVEHYLESKYEPQDHFPAWMKSELNGLWEDVSKREALITDKLSAKPSHAALRLNQLVHLFGLNPREQDALLICLLPQVDSRYRRLFGYLQDDASRTRPNVELVLEILGSSIVSRQAGRAIFEPVSALLANHLLVLGAGPQGDESLLVRPVGVDDRIAGYLFGSNAFDARLVGIVSQVFGAVPVVDDLVVGDALLEQIKRMAIWWQAQPKPGADSGATKEKIKGATFFLYGPEGSPVRQVAKFLQGGKEASLLEVDTAAALRSPYGFELVVQLAFREALLQGAAILWTGCETLLEPDLASSERSMLQVHMDILAAAAARFPGLVFLSSTVSWDPAGRFHNKDHLFLRLAFPVPSYEVRQKLWQHSLESKVELELENMNREALSGLLANSFQLTEGQIHSSLSTAFELARARDPGQPRLTVDDILDGCRRQSGQGLATLARRLEPRSGLTFEDLKLPPATQRKLEELRQRIRLREQVLTGLGFEQRLPLSLGLVVLFTGSSGTGKTMAAELLAAKDMNVDLYKVDLSAVVSKYIGDTEKRLAELFDQAEEMNACLFIDEADALFGKRGDVKDASDRYANMQVNYLLQRIEEYSGVVILATNLRSNLDSAFLRRIHFSLDFPFPDEIIRYQIWRGMFPDKLERPGDQVLAALAKQFELNGGSIRNVVLAAAFRALARVEGKARPIITVRDLILSIEQELDKAGKIATRGVFGAEFYKFIEEEAEENKKAARVSQQMIIGD